MKKIIDQSSKPKLVSISENKRSSTVSKPREKLKLPLNPTSKKLPKDTYLQKLIEQKESKQMLKQDSRVSMEDELELRNKENGLKSEYKESKNLSLLKSKISSRSQLVNNTS